MVNPVLVGVFLLFTLAAVRRYPNKWKAVLLWTWFSLILSAQIAAFWDSRFISYQFSLMDASTYVILGILALVFIFVQGENIRSIPQQRPIFKNKIIFPLVLLAATAFFTAIFVSQADSIFPPAPVTIIH